ncbi:uncharacterized protein LOC121640028 [Melanotaenia boesemani]|uniref:uncharacterized protein LOC121640028 n=1 Tax=Melanotaenia boesemani TaxID=1250792 RepID=UPI001C04541E|nr:uncharacterized protein LOC121640028 [Melanotaenia boesemani]
MVYAKAVWLEGDKQFEGVIPKNWIQEEKNVVRWPKKSVHSAHKKKMDPEVDWKTFPLVKIKTISDNEKDCEDYNYTSSAQTDHEGSTIVPEENRKRHVKKRTYDDFVDGQSEDDVSVAVKKTNNTDLHAYPKPPEIQKNKASATIDQNTPMESTMDNDELTWSRQLPNSSSEDAESEHDIGHEQSNSRRERSNCSSQRSSYGSDGGRSTSLGSPPGHSFPRSGPLSLRERSNSPDRESSHGSDVGCSSCHSQSAVGSTPRCSSSRYGPSSSRREHHTSSNRRTSHGSAKHANPRHSTSGHETPRAPTDNSVDIFPMPTAKFQKCVLKKLVELTEEVKHIGCAEPSASTYHVRRMENMEQVDKLEDELQNNEARDLLISQLSRVGGKNTRDCTTKILDSCCQKVGQQSHRPRN